MIGCLLTPFLRPTDLRENPDTVRKLAERRQAPILYAAGSGCAREIGAIRFLECSALTQKGLKTVLCAALRRDWPKSSTADPSDIPLMQRRGNSVGSQPAAEAKGQEQGLHAHVSPCTPLQTGGAFLHTGQAPKLSLHAPPFTTPPVIDRTQTP